MYTVNSYKKHLYSVKAKAKEEAQGSFDKTSFGHGEVQLTYWAPTNSVPHLTLSYLIFARDFMKRFLNFLDGAS